MDLYSKTGLRKGKERSMISLFLSVMDNFNCSSHKGKCLGGTGFEADKPRILPLLSTSLRESGKVAIKASFISGLCFFEGSCDREGRFDF